MPKPVAAPTDPVAVLRGTSMFSSLDDVGLRAVVEVADWITLDPGELLFRRGEPGDSVCVLLQGRLEAAVPDAAGESSRIVAVAPGESVGELALLTGDPRSADVRAVRHSLLVRLTRANFLSLVRRAVGVMLSVARFVSERLANPTGDPGRLVPRVLSVVAGSTGAPVDGFVIQLAGALGDPRPPVLTRDDALAAVGGDERGLEDLPRLGAWLATHEQRHAQLILRADPEPSAWTRACLMFADMVLIVAEAGARPRVLDPSLARVEGSTLRRVELVLVQRRGSSRPRGTRRWLDAIAVDHHHHLRQNHAGDLARLCRRLTGTSVAIAFGGGAARGMAHVGVVRAFEELGVPIDMTCGTSMGSVVGGMCALGHDLRSLVDGLDPFFSDYTLLRPTALPVLSMLSGARLETMCRTLFGDAEVEDTWLPYFAVASNLTEARPELIDTGSLAFAVRASGSVPGMWPPVFRGNQVLVDGVVTNNLPGDVVANRHQGFTVAVNVIPRKDPLFAADAVPRSRGQAVLSRVNPFNATRHPLLPDLAMRSLFMATVRHADAVRQQVDVFIEPDVGGFGFLFEASRRDEIVEAGYRGALAALETALAREPRIPRA